jgi:hypothetical protein
LLIKVYEYSHFSDYSFAWGTAPVMVNSQPFGVLAGGDAANLKRVSSLLLLIARLN